MATGSAPSLVVAITHSHSCFVGIPVQWADALWDELSTSHDGIVFQLSWNSRIKSKQEFAQEHPVHRQAFVGWSGDCSQSAPQTQSRFTHNPPSGTISIDAAFAEALNLPQDALVSVSLVQDVPLAASVTVDPASPDDWEILALHAQYLESQLLNQIKVVFQDEIFTVWLHNNTCIRLIVTKMTPADHSTDSSKPSHVCMRLAQDVEIIVAPKPRSAKKPKKQNPFVNVSVSARFLPSDLAHQPLPTVSPWTVVMSPHTFISTCPDLESDSNLLENAVVYLQHLDFDLIMIQQSDTDASKQSPSHSLPIAFARLKISDTVPHGHVVVGSPLQHMLVLNNAFSRIRITVVESPDIDPESEPTKTASVPSLSLIVQDQADKNAHVASRIREWISNIDTESSCSDEWIVFDGMPIPLTSSSSSDTMHAAKLVFSDSVSKFKPESALDCAPQWRLVLRDDLIKNIHDDISVHVGTSSSFMPRYGSHREGTSDSSTTLPGFNDMIQDAVEYIAKCSLLHTMFRSSICTPYPGPLLIHGSSGSGKTTTCRTISTRLERDYHLYTITVSCARIKSSTLTQIQHAMMMTLYRAVFHAPSLIILDDLDTITSADTDDQTAQGRSACISHMFMRMVNDVSRRWRAKQVPFIHIIATSVDKTSLHASIRERYVFGHDIRVPDLSVKLRREILQHMVSVHERNGFVLDSSVNLDSISTKMDGYVVDDMKQLVDRVIQRCIVRHARQPHRDNVKRITMQDVRGGMDGYRPSSLRHIQLHQSRVEWTDIGGMRQAKHVLVQTIKWPLLYPQIFQKSPIRLRTGVLLYGYPGCGKTMLASSVSQHCNMNFVSVKGPELLNKYIGASEKSVRDLFQRAQSARPCILFFDEFESIAPKRGHDNTGVTDRVVNQLLTQMDGVEGLNGVYIIAATSRPDLIDPALLRPGRLDQHVLCDMPSLDDRVDILECVTKTIPISDDVDVHEIAACADGFSGADLQGVMYTAQLDAIRESIGNSLSLSSDLSESKQESADENLIPFVVVSGQDHMHLAHGKSIQSHLKSIKNSVMPTLSENSTASVDPSRSDSSQAILVHWRHVQQALLTARPSVSQSDRNRLHRIYQKFMNGDESVEGVGTHTSLA